MTNPGMPIAPVTVTTDIGSYWRDQFGAHLSGWAHCTRVPVERLFLVLGDNAVELELTPFPEVVRHYPECGDVIPVRWHGYVAGPPGEPLRLRVVTPLGSARWTCACRSASCTRRSRIRRRRRSSAASCAR